MSWSTSSYDTYASSLNGKWEWKDSYRWVAFEEATNKEIDEQITEKWLNTKEKTFTFPLTTGTYFSQSHNRGNYSCEVQLDYSRKRINKIQQINKNSYYKREMRRTPAFQLPTGNAKKLSSIFDKLYADKQEKTIMSESGMLKFFKDCGVNPESHETLIISYLLNCQEMGIYDKQEFIDGFKKCGCSDKSDIKKCVQSKCNQINNNTKKFKLFYRWIFNHVKEDEKKKTIPNELAVQLWSIIFQKEKNKMYYLDKWLKYCTLNANKDLKVISKDLWQQIYDFLIETILVGRFPYFLLVFLYQIHYFLNISIAGRVDVRTSEASEY